jgi:hypothetical protein
LLPHYFCLVSEFSLRVHWIESLMYHTRSDLHFLSFGNKIFIDKKSEVFMAVSSKITVFWDIALCSLVYTYQCDGGSKSVRSGYTHLIKYMASCLIKTQYWFVFMLWTWNRWCIVALFVFPHVHWHAAFLRHKVVHITKS